MTWSVDYRSGHVSNGGDVVSGIRSLRIPINTDRLKDTTSGSPYNRTAHVVSAVPQMSFESMDVSEAFQHLGAIGQCVTDFKAYGQLQNCSGVPGGAVHMEYAVVNGCVVPTTLSVDHQGNASINYDVFAASDDGLAAPISRSSGVAMPAGNVGKRYELFRCDVAGLTLEGKRNVSINWNPNVTQESADSVVYPTTVSLTSVQPIMTIRGVDHSWAVPMNGLRGDVTDTILYLRDRDQATTANAHISIAMDCSVSWNSYFEGTPDNPAEGEIQCDAYTSDGSSPLTVQTGIALP